MKFGLIVATLTISFLYCCKSADIESDLEDATQALKKLKDKKTYLDTLKSLDDWGTRLVISAAMTVFYLSDENIDLHEDEVSSSMWSKYLALNSVVKSLKEIHKGLGTKFLPDSNLGITESDMEAMDAQIQLAMNNSGIIGKYQKDIFLMMYEKSHATVSQDLYTSMTSNDQLSNIFQLARQNSKNDKRVTFELVTSITILFVHSVYYDTSYKLLKSETEEDMDNILNDVQFTIQSMLAVVGETINQLDIDLTNAYKQQFGLDVQEYLQRQTSTNSYTMAKELHELLENKFYWRHWFVVITGNKGEVDIKINTCDGLSLMNVKNKHVFVTSADREELFDADLAMEHLTKATDLVRIGLFADSFAAAINDRISASCSNFKMFGTFTTDTDAAVFGRNRQFGTSAKRVIFKTYHYKSFIMG